VGTRYFWEPTRPGERIARELGLVLGGAPARSVAAHIDAMLAPRAAVQDVVSALHGLTAR
jgi:hypothetical protein